MIGIVQHFRKMNVISFIAQNCFKGLENIQPRANFNVTSSELKRVFISGGVCYRKNFPSKSFDVVRVPFRFEFDVETGL